MIEPLERRQLMAADSGTASAMLLSSEASATMSATASVVAPQRVYLTGNSMTDAVWYGGLTALLGRDGSPVQLGRQTGPGYAQAYNLNLKPGYFTSGVDPNQPGALDPWGNYQEAFATGSWNALTLQPNDRRLLVDGDPKNPTGTQNQADVPMSIEFMKKFVVNNPNAQVYAQSRPVRRTDLDDNGQPTGITFNYSAEWLKTYVDSGANKNFNIISRSFTQQYMTLVRQAQLNEPLTKNMKPIRLIPVAEAWYNVDQMLKAGKFAGTTVDSMLDFYVDKSHPSNAGAYLIALTFYSSLTGNDPRGVAPTSHYMNAMLSDTKVQALLQQAVYEAITYTGYTGWTTPMPVQPGTLGNIRTTVFSDADHDAVRDTDEGVMSGVKVFVDADNDGVFDSGEKNATTDIAGQVTFSGLAAGASYRVRVVPPTNSAVTTANPQLVSVTAGATRDVQAGVTKLGSISGRLFADDDSDGVLDTGEAALPDRVVYVDQDNDNVLDTSERRTTSDAAGNFKFTGLMSGDYRIKRVFPLGYRASTPPAVIKLAAGQNVTGVLIGAAKTTTTTLGSIAGRLFADTDKDGVLDAGEPLLADRVVFIDADNDNILDSTERRVTSDAAGNFTFTGLVAGTYRIKRVFPAGYRLSTPPAVVNLASGQNFSGVLIGAAAI